MKKKKRKKKRTGEEGRTGVELAGQHSSYPMFLSNSIPKNNNKNGIRIQTLKNPPTAVLMGFV